MFENLKKKNVLITVLGPTASGKTSFAARLAAIIDGEIISADSRQVYRSMNIGTGKDYKDYKVGGKTIKYHLIDIADAGYKYNVYEYQQDFLQAFQDIIHRQKIPVLCGGTGMYIEAVTKGYRLIPVPPDDVLRARLQNYSLEELAGILSKYKKLHNRSEIDTKKRAIRAIEIFKYYKEQAINSDYPTIHSVYIGIKYNREKEKQRIFNRLQERLKGGMISEVESLLHRGIQPRDLIYYGLEYKYVTRYLQGDISYDEMENRLNIAIRQFAKRQMTWFRKMEREGTKIHWIDGSMNMEEKIKKALLILESEQGRLS